MTRTEREITRRSKLGPFQALVATAVVVGAWLFTPVIYVIAVVAVLWVTFGSFFTILRLKGHNVEVNGDLLKELDTSGRELGTIDISRSFTYEFLYREQGTAIYRLRQGRSRVDFSSDLPQAEYLVRDIMKLEWPPQDKARFSA